MTKCYTLKLHDNAYDKADAKAIAIPRVFSENSRAKDASAVLCKNGFNAPE